MPWETVQFAKISISWQTVTCCICELATCEENTWKFEAWNFEYYSLVLKENTVVSNATQLANFVHEVDEVDVKLEIFVCGIDKYRCHWHCPVSDLCTWSHKVQTQQHCPVSDVHMWGRWNTDVIDTAQLAIFVCGVDKYRSSMTLFN